MPYYFHSGVMEQLVGDMAPQQSILTHMCTLHSVAQEVASVLLRTHSFIGGSRLVGSGTLLVYLCAPARPRLPCTCMTAKSPLVTEETDKG